MSARAVADGGQTTKAFGSMTDTAVTFDPIANRRDVRQTMTAVGACGYSDRNVWRCRASRSVGASLLLARRLVRIKGDAR